jgi:hypothetical protein
MAARGTRQHSSVNIKCRPWCCGPNEPLCRICRTLQVLQIAKIEFFKTSKWHFEVWNKSYKKYFWCKR